MDRPAATIGAEAARLSVERSPQRLLKEAFSLAVILMAVLLLSLLEFHAFLPGQGYLSSLALLVLCWWHARRFRIVVPLRSAAPRGIWFPLLFALGLVGALCCGAAMPIAPQPGPEPSVAEAIHLVLLVPLAEEFYFRGLLFEHLRRGMATWQAIVFSCLFFALLHLSSDAVFTAGLLALAACGLVLLAGGLECAIALHAAWNAFTVIADLDDPMLRWTWAVAASAFAAAIIFGCRSRRSAPRTVEATN